jgi:two-component system sensor histidine kinase CiaH
MFESARLKLTTWYLFIIMVISVMFSVVIYEVLSNEVEDIALAQRVRIERNLQRAGCVYPDTNTSRMIPPIPVTPEIVEEAKRRILWMLVVVNSGILVIAGGSGYLLAGKTLKPIKEMVTEQNRFISDASHELRTPLTSLRTAFEVYLRDKKPSLDEAKELVSESLIEVERLQKLSDSLLQLTQYQKVNGHQVFEKIATVTVLDEALRNVKSISKMKNIKIEKDIVDIQFSAIKESVVELFTILLDNAIKYSPENSTITIKSKKHDKSFNISIADQGIGISAIDLPHIFDRFYRSDRARTTAVNSGYGLGLSIAQKIVKLHNGSITVTSESDKGSIFTVKLPIHQKYKTV